MLSRNEINKPRNCSFHKTEIKATKLKKQEQTTIDQCGLGKNRQTTCLPNNILFLRRLLYLFLLLNTLQSCGLMIAPLVSFIMPRFEKSSAYFVICNSPSIGYVIMCAFRNF